VLFIAFAGTCPVAHAQKAKSAKKQIAPAAAVAKPSNQDAGLKSPVARISSSADENSKPSDKLVLFMPLEATDEQMQAFEELKQYPGVKVSTLESKDNAFLIKADNAQMAMRVKGAFPELDLFTPQYLQKITSYLKSAPALLEAESLLKILNQYN